MPVKTLITDPETGRQAAVVDTEEKNALVVATRPLKSYATKIKFFTNPDYGYNMNVTLGFAGTPDKIHNGIDNSYWTASAISGTWTFNSTDQAHAGTKSIDATATVNNDIAQIAKGSSIDLSGYVAITGWIYLSLWDDTGQKKIEVYGWDTGTSAMVGIAINLKDYIDIGALNSWQKFTIPLPDMNLAAKSIDAIRIETIDTGIGVAPNYYLDDMQIEETTAPEEFNIKPDANTWLHVNNLNIFLVDACASTLANATMPYLSYNKLLNMTSLTNGILYQGRLGGKIRFALPVRNIGDILMLPGSRIESCGSDGTNTFLKMFLDLKYPIILQAEHDDKLSFMISDDLSGLIKIVISANCREEAR